MLFNAWKNKADVFRKANKYKKFDLKKSKRSKQKI